MTHGPLIPADLAADNSSLGRDAQAIYIAELTMAIGASRASSACTHSRVQGTRSPLRSVIDCCGDPCPGTGETVGGFLASRLALALAAVPAALAQSQPAAMTFDSRQTLLMFMQPDEAEATLASHRPSTIDPRSPAEAAVIETCSRGGSGYAPCPRASSAACRSRSSMP